MGREQNFVLNNKYDQLLSFLHYNCYMKVNCTFQVICIHDKHCIFASILLITYKRILYVNKLTGNYNLSMSMTWKEYFLIVNNIKIILSKLMATICVHIRNKEHNRYLYIRNLKYAHLTLIYWQHNIHLVSSTCQHKYK